MTHAPFTQARWIWSQDPGDARFAARRFRGAFTLETPQTLTVHVSADSRYILSIDGQLIGSGPARSDIRHTIYETYTINLAAGRHVFAATVIAYHGLDAPIAEMHEEGVFLLEAQNAEGEAVCATGGAGEWRLQRDGAWRTAPIHVNWNYFAIGTAEVVDGSLIPHGWEGIDFDDSEWETPSTRYQAWLRELPTDLADPGGRWRLTPRDIPALREERREFQIAPQPPILGESDSGSPRIGGEGATIPAHTRREWILSAGEYANGYPVITMEGGAGATVEITYAEALTTEGVKGVRDEGTGIIGFSDVYRPGGGTETYSPLHWRAFRFVKLTVQTEGEALTISDFHYRMTGYPWNRQATLTVKDGPTELQQIQDTDFRTLERCTGETFMDCPYYEQLQYVGDTRLQALVSYVTTGDTRLGARAVRLFEQSRLPEGLTQSRYPSRIEQVIPPFSLIWVLMVEDLYRYAPGETALVADCLLGCQGVLEWFGRHLTPEGVLGGPLPWWNFVDWCEGWDGGVPPCAAAGLPSATLNLQYLAALQAFVRLHESLGDPREYEFWQAQADMLSDGIIQTFWDPDARLLREGPTDDWGCTQHAQAWGLLTGVIPTEAIEDVVDSLHTDDTLVQATYYHTFYIIEALAKVGRLEELWTRWLSPWREALQLHFSTWPEKPEPTRSDCHAWSAWPTYALYTHVLGIAPGEPGFAAPAFTPCHVAGWDSISGTIPTPSGLLSVSVTWDENGEAKVETQETPA